MINLPKHILDAAIKGHTSLGVHPSYPPEEEVNFVVKLLSQYFNKLNVENESSTEELRNKLNLLLTECKKIEDKNKAALEELCLNSVNKLFNIPLDTIVITSNLVNNIKSSEERLVPESTVDFSFDSIEDMNNLTDEIYKRRMLNALIAGAAIYYSENIGYYVKELFDIDAELPSLYKKIFNLNNKLLYIEKERINSENTTNAGKVDVFISSTEEQVKIESKALFFPILVEETIKGLLELAISHGLPKDSKKAQYVIMKSDFKLAEVWDMRLGLPLWELIEEVSNSCGFDMADVGINFFLMTLSSLPPKEFNSFLQEVFAKTKSGKKMMVSLMEEIILNKEQDDFDDYMTQKNADSHQITDDEDFYSPEELLIDSEIY